MITSNIQWDDCREQIDLVALAIKEPILFYDEVLALCSKSSFF